MGQGGWKVSKPSLSFSRAGLPLASQRPVSPAHAQDWGLSLCLILYCLPLEQTHTCWGLPGILLCLFLMGWWMSLCLTVVWSCIYPGQFPISALLSSYRKTSESCMGEKSIWNHRDLLREGESFKFPKGASFCITHPVLTSCFIRECWTIPGHGSLSSAGCEEWITMGVNRLYKTQLVARGWREPSTSTHDSQGTTAPSLEFIRNKHGCSRCDYNPFHGFLLLTQCSGKNSTSIFYLSRGSLDIPPPCILPDLALSSCLKAELLEEPHCPAVGRLPAGHSGTSPKELLTTWTCWMPRARLPTLSSCFCLNLPKLGCHRDAFLKQRGSTRFTKVLLCSLGHLCSWSLCRDATCSMMAQRFETLRTLWFASGADEAPTLARSHAATCKQHVFGTSSLPPLPYSIKMPHACCVTDLQTCGHSAILIFLYLPSAISELRGKELQ